MLPDMIAMPHQGGRKLVWDGGGRGGDGRCRRADRPGAQGSGGGGEKEWGGIMPVRKQKQQVRAWESDRKQREHNVVEDHETMTGLSKQSMSTN